MIEKGDEAFNGLAETMQRMTYLLAEMGARTSEKAEEINALADTGKPPDIQALKRITNQIADHLADIVLRLTAETPIYAEGFKRAIDPYMRVVGMPDAPLTREQISTMITSTNRLAAENKQAATGLADMRNSFEKTPRVTTALNRARRKVVGAIDLLTAEFEKSLRLTRELSEALQRRHDGIT